MWVSGVGGVILPLVGVGCEQDGGFHGESTFFLELDKAARLS